MSWIVSFVLPDLIVPLRMTFHSVRLTDGAPAGEAEGTVEALAAGVGLGAAEGGGGLACADDAAAAVGWSVGAAPAVVHAATMATAATVARVVRSGVISLLPCSLE